uniref:ABC transporter domain-containing protein n=1 Tax=mine drainage metagenome TaxID=410659 RepID=E6PG12_9ZZZZ
MASLAIDGLTKRFGKKTAVDDLSFAVGAGEIVGLLGPNGAGKSTTFLALAGFLRPESGTISWDGVPLGPERGRVISLIPETPEVYPVLTIWEHLVFVAKSSRLAPGWESKGATLLERLGLADQRDTLGRALSKGMRQKTLIAATLLADTPVLLLDEPMIGLDPQGQRELREMLLQLRADGTAILISTHMIEQAQQLCDRIVIIKEGRFVAGGTFDELRERVGREDAEELFLELTRA